MSEIFSFLGSLLGKVVAAYMAAAQIFFGFTSGSGTVFVRTYPGTVVETVWTAYRDKIQKDGRTIDRQRNFLTTSEGQSYSLLRAVWMDDKETFDRVLKWTNHNLRKREGDRLFAWLWGQDEEGRWDVMRAEGGLNTASDADQDIALALIFAHKRWNQEHYLTEAREILDDIWRVEVVTIKGRPYLTAGNWAKIETRPTLNPSYFSFAAYPIFAAIDPARDWAELKSTSYEVLKASSRGALDSKTSAGLPPDWISIDRTTGAIFPPIHRDKTTNFSDDAFRALWRVSLDFKWHRDPRAKEYLESLKFFDKEWEREGKIFATYRHNGEATRQSESLSLYGALLAHYWIIYAARAEEIYLTKLAPLYNPDIEDLREDLGYYPQNWVWFGLAFYSDKLPNLFLIQN